MPDLVGGLRVRLILDNFRNNVVEGLDALGWRDATIYDASPGTRQHKPLDIVDEPVDWNEPIEPNKVSFWGDIPFEEQWELGSSLKLDSWSVMVDVYAESDAVGYHLAGDIRDICRGKFPSIGKGRQGYNVYDLSQDPVPVEPFAFVDIETVNLDRAHDFPQAWLRHWFVVTCTLADYYAEDE